MYMAHSKPQAWQERMLKIIESETPLPMNWKPSFPDFDSHLDEIGFIEEENEESFEPFEEE
ncbi:hypothetical protein N9C12_04895 [Candidatus Poseidoniaceae archaeon]|nr:hypothetical protein [Candidatus Poseidoniaceae archaeon]